MRLGKATGSLVNHVLASMTQPVPAVGDPATICGWTDRYPATVVAVEEARTGRLVYVTVQEDDAVRTDDKGMTDSGQEYAYTRNPNGRSWTFKLHAGTWREVTRTDTGARRMRARNDAAGLVLGRREKYHDFSF